MANRYFHKDICCFDKGFVLIDGEATVASGGNVTSYSGRGISSVEQVSATNVGYYKVTLSDKYNKLIDAQSSMATSAVFDPTSVAGLVNLNSTASVVSGSSPAVVFQAQLASAATAAKLPEGTFRFIITCKNSSV